MQNNTGKIVKVSGPLIVAENMADVKMYDVVKVSKEGLVGEVIELRGDKASIQVYEETTGLKPGDPVRGTGAPMNVLLGPGIIDNIFENLSAIISSRFTSLLISLTISSFGYDSFKISVHAIILEIGVPS